MLAIEPLLTDGMAKQFRENFDQSKSPTIAALGRMPGSEGNHGQTSEHTQ